MPDPSPVDPQSVSGASEHGGDERVESGAAEHGGGVEGDENSGTSSTEFFTRDRDEDQALLDCRISTVGVTP